MEALENNAAAAKGDVGEEDAGLMGVMQHKEKGCRSSKEESQVCRLRGEATQVMKKTWTNNLIEKRFAGARVRKTEGKEVAGW